MSKLPTANEETPLLTPTVVDQASSAFTAPNTNAKISAKKVSPWYAIGALFGLTFSFGALYAPMIQFYTIIFCYRYYQQQSDGSDADFPLENCAIPEVQAIVSEAQAIIMFLTYGSSLLVASYFGTLSDRKGRRLVIMTSITGSLIQIIMFIATIKYMDIFGISLVFIAPIIKGLFAGDSILIAAVQAYITDCTTQEERTIAFGNMMATIFLGASIGPSVASFLIKETGRIISIFYMVICINAVVGVYVWLVMPESSNIQNYQAPARQEKQSFLQRINIFSALQVLQRTSSEHASQHALPFIALVQFFLYLVAMPPIFLYAMLQFGWTAYEGGLFISLSSITKVLAMLVVLPILSKLFHRNKASVSQAPTSPVSKTKEPSSPLSTSSLPPTTPADNKHDTRSKQDIRHAILFDSWMIRIGISIEIICFVFFGLVTTSIGFTITGAIQSLALLAAPSLRSLLTSLVDPSEIGELLGAMAVLEACSMIISQLAINTIYSASVTTMPNLIFFVCAVVSGLALTFSLFIKPSKPLSTTNSSLTVNEEC